MKQAFKVTSSKRGEIDVSEVAKLALYRMNLWTVEVGGLLDETETREVKVPVALEDVCVS